jgi:hypothetical protein
LAGLWRQPFNDFEALKSGQGISRLEGQCPALAIGSCEAECRWLTEG